MDYGWTTSVSGSGDGPVNGVPNAHHLRRVIPIAQRLTIDEGVLTVTSLELYEDGSILHYFILATEERQAEVKRARREYRAIAESGDREAMRRFKREHFSNHLGDSIQFRLRDDTGTRYWSIPMGGSANGIRFRSSLGSTPAVPETAAYVRVDIYQGLLNRNGGEAVPSTTGGWAPYASPDVPPPGEVTHTIQVDL